MKKINDQEFKRFIVFILPCILIVSVFTASLGWYTSKTVHEMELASIPMIVVPPEQPRPDNQTDMWVSFEAEITAYPPLAEHTDDSPLITASNTRVRHGIVALSRDIERKYNLKFGDKIHIEGIGSFYFYDRMNKRIKNGVDIFMWDKQDCLEFGRKKKIVRIKHEHSGRKERT